MDKSRVSLRNSVRDQLEETENLYMRVATPGSNPHSSF